MNQPFVPAVIANVQSVADLSPLAPETIVPSVTGAIVEVGRYIYKEEGQYGPYSFQDAKITDGRSTFPVLFSSCPEFNQADVGVTKTFQCSAGKFGPAGLQIKVKKAYKDRPAMNVLQIGKQAIVSTPGTVTAASFAPTQAPAPARPPSEAPNLHQAAAPTTDLATMKRQVHDARQIIAQMANLFILCGMAADYVESCHMDENGEKMTPDQRQSATACLFIEANKRGLANTMPVNKIREYLPERNS